MGERELRIRYLRKSEVKRIGKELRIFNIRRSAIRSKRMWRGNSGSLMSEKNRRSAVKNGGRKKKERALKFNTNFYDGGRSVSIRDAENGDAKCTKEM